MRKFLNNGRRYMKVVSKEAESYAEEDETLRESLKWIGQVGKSLEVCLSVKIDVFGDKKSPYGLS
jgi:hypothetical protein